MMPKAILHVGTMKTGTTSIQETLSQNTAVLKRNGYAYLGPPMRHSSVLGPKLDEISGTEQNLIISDEGLWHFAHSKRSDTANLAKLLKGFEVTVLIYLRRPDSFIDSWFQQGLKSGTGSQTMSKFLESGFVKSGMEFSKRISEFENLFGEGCIKLRAYERSQLAQGDAVLDFFQTIGLPGSEFTLSKQENMTPNTDNLLLRSLFQRDLPRSAHLQRQLEKLDKHLEKNGYAGRRYSMLSKREIEDITNKYRPEFIRLQSQYGGGAAPDFFQSWPDLNDLENDPRTLRTLQEAILGKDD